MRKVDCITHGYDCPANFSSRLPLYRKCLLCQEWKMSRDRIGKDKNFYSSYNICKKCLVWMDILSTHPLWERLRLEAFEEYCQTGKITERVILSGQVLKLHPYNQKK